LSGQRTDYAKATPPDIGDYSDIHTCPDPILAAIAVTGERGKQGWGHWVKVLNRARCELGREQADRLFRNAVATTWGEMKTDALRKPGAILNLKLQKVFGLSHSGQTVRAAP
jgi:hypothetical protein